LLRVVARQLAKPTPRLDGTKGILAISKETGRARPHTGTDL
jgi:hypothetical protein